MRRTTLLHNLMPADSLSRRTEIKNDTSMPHAFAVSRAQLTQKDTSVNRVETIFVSVFNSRGGSVYSANSMAEYLP